MIRAAAGSVHLPARGGPRVYEAGARSRYTEPPRAGCAESHTVSKQDTHFINMFSLLIGGLVAFAICIFIFARAVGRTQNEAERSEAAYSKDIATRIAPLSQEAIAGQDNTALAIKAQTPEGAGTAAVAAIPKNGKELFEQVCSVCHGQGIAGAPKAGDKAAWAPRIAEGKPTLYQHALNGYQGGPGGGVMPPKGGRPDLPDALIKQAVDYMVSLAQ
jgi:cytochrome c5